MSKKIIGIGASDGITVAKALILEEEKVNVVKTKNINVEEEVLKLENGIKKTIDSLKQLEIITLEKLGQEKADIFIAHQQIAEDPEMIEQIKEIIKSDNVNADYATKVVTDNYYEIFKNMDDPYFQERSADIKDISERLIKNILGIKIIDLTTIDEEVIIIAEDLTPSQTAQLNKKFVKGFLTNIGGRTSHAAIMARSLEIPAVLGLKNITEIVKNNEIIALDGKSGFVDLNLTKEDISSYEKQSKDFNEFKEQLKKFKSSKSVTKDGITKDIEANIGSPSDLVGALENGAEGIGLFRSEFLYMDSDQFPTEEEQFNSYKKVVEGMNGKIVVIRTLDIGGDKKLSYFNFPEEMNPFLGYRAIRFTLDRKEIFRTQIRALLRASAFGKLGIMFPMVATIDEFKQSKNFVLECMEELKNENIEFDANTQIGMMVEIPSTAVLSEQFARYADFFSIGTNDLIQYSMAADRMSEKVSYLYQPLNPSILKLIQMTIEGAHKNNKWVAMCGEMAGEELALPILIGLGLDAFSMSASSILKSRSLMSKIDSIKAKELALKSVNSETSEEVVNLVQDFLKTI